MSIGNLDSDSNHEHEQSQAKINSLESRMKLNSNEMSSEPVFQSKAVSYNLLILSMFDIGFIIKQINEDRLRCTVICGGEESRRSRSDNNVRSHLCITFT